MVNVPLVNHVCNLKSKDFSFSMFVPLHLKHLLFLGTEGNLYICTSFWLKRAISSDSAKMTHPQRETLFTGPWSLTLRKNLKSQKAPFCRLQKQSQRVFINTKNVPWIFSPLKGFLVTCPIPLIVFRSTFRTSELQSLKRLPKAGVYFYSCQN